MNPIQRAQDILLKPKETWPQIASEPASVASIYRPWLLMLAAIPALASFLGLTLIGGPVRFSHVAGRRAWCSWCLATWVRWSWFT